MSFGIWFILEQMAFTISHPNLNAPRQKLEKRWEIIDADTERVTCDQAELSKQERDRWNNPYMLLKPINFSFT